MVLALVSPLAAQAPPIAAEDAQVIAGIMASDEYFTQIA
jgi:hypothetical protein